MRYTLLLLLVIIAALHSGCMPAGINNKTIADSVLAYVHRMDKVETADSVTVTKAEAISQKELVTATLAATAGEYENAKRDYCHDDTTLMRYTEAYSKDMLNLIRDTVKTLKDKLHITEDTVSSDRMKMQMDSTILDQYQYSAYYKKSVARYQQASKAHDSLTALLPAADSARKNNFMAHVRIIYPHGFTKAIVYLDKDYKVVAGKEDH